MDEGWDGRMDRRRSGDPGARVLSLSRCIDREGGRCRKFQILRFRTLSHNTAKVNGSWVEHWGSVLEGFEFDSDPSVCPRVAFRIWASWCLSTRRWRSGVARRLGAREEDRDEAVVYST